MDAEERLLELFQSHGGFLTRQVAFGSGLHSRVLAHWVADGRARRVQRGVYCLRGVDDAEIGVIGVHLRVPESILCLDTALYHHGLLRRRPAFISFALRRGTRIPVLEDPALRIVRCAAHLFRLGVTRVEVGGIEIATYTPERSLIDALRFHRLVPEAITLEALSAFLNASGLEAGLERLVQMAEPCRAMGALKLALKEIGMRPIPARATN
jgi:predicted transcriptional regulator of viral defense system